MLRVFTWFHVLISLIGIATGFIVVFGFLTAEHWATLTNVFLWTTIGTSVTGFFFPFEKFLPSHTFGVLSLVLLTFTCLGLYEYQLAGSWRGIYVVTATISQHLNVFVLVAQLFQKVPSLRAYAPTQSEPPFLIAQGIVFVPFLLAAIASVFTFHPAS